ncbi:MAG: hypothetical protein D6722_05485, partial [Bacteroidetes bacterium]
MPARTHRSRKRRSFRAAAQPEGSRPASGVTLSPPPFQAKASKGPLQREEDPEKEKKKSDFDYDISVLPPEAKLSLGAWGLQADTSAASFGYKDDDLAAKLTYKYGGALTAGLDYGQFAGTAGFNPSDKSSSLTAKYGAGSGSFGWQPQNNLLSLGGKYEDFNAGLN